jgi:tetratricopeptide (TPR) repeat protein
LEKIGDQSVSEVLAEQYPNFGTPEKAATLNALFRLNSPRFRELAAHALLSNESALVGAACQGLQKQGDPDAVRLLADALEKSSASSAWSYICNTLATLATPDSQAALRKARDDGDQSKSRYALNALQSLRQRSPGMQYVYQARSFEQQKQFKEALEQYDVAIKIDSELPEAFSGRGNIFLLQNKRDQARPDFERALELDPYSSIAVTGLAIVMVLDGKRDEAIAQVEQARGKVGNDALFAYNAACVYARALESLEHDEQVDNREQKIEEYRDKALSELKRSVQGGFRDYEWMRNDPDLKSLRTTPEFKNIHSPGKSGDATSDDAPQLGDNDEAVNGDIPLPQFVFPRAIQGGF